MTMSKACLGGGPQATSKERLLAALASGTPDIGVLWEFCAHFEWPDRGMTVDGIANWLGPADGSRILDCACGSGFPAIDLAQRGYDITCSDGSPIMLEHFRRNASRAGAEVVPALLTWDKLSSHYSALFDVVMCRGGASFLYAGAWDEDVEPELSAVTTAIGQFVACIRPGGRLYADMISAEGLAHREPQRTVHPPLVIGDHVVELEEELINDPGRGLRIWRSHLTIDGTRHEFRRRSHYLGQDELVGILTSAGLTDVRKEAVPGEHYEVFTGRRPCVMKAGPD